MVDLVWRRYRMAPHSSFSSSPFFSIPVQEPTMWSPLLCVGGDFALPSWQVCFLCLRRYRPTPSPASPPLSRQQSWSTLHTHLLHITQTHIVIFGLFLLTERTQVGAAGYRHFDYFFVLFFRWFLSAPADTASSYYPSRRGRRGSQTVSRVV